MKITKNTLILSVIQAVIAIAGVIATASIKYNAKLDMLSIFFCNIVAGIISVVLYLLTKKKPEIPPVAANVVLIISLFSNIIAARTTNLLRILDYIKPFEIIYYIVILLFFFAAFLFTATYIEALVKKNKADIETSEDTTQE